MSNAKKLLQKETVVNALSSIASDYYQSKFSRQHGLGNWLNFETTSSNLIHTAFFLELTGVELIQIKKLKNDAQKFLEFAAQIFEYVAKYMTTSYDDKVKQFEHAAICYECSGYSGNCVVMAKTALKELNLKEADRDIKEQSQIDRYLVNLRALVLTLLSRDFKDLRSRIKTITDTFPLVENEIRKCRDDGEQRYAIIEFLNGRELLLATEKFSDFVVSGNRSSYDECYKAMKRCIKLAFNVDNAEEFSLMSLLQIVLQNIYDRSVWVTLTKRIRDIEAYLRLLTSGDNPIVELWESQLQAIDQGLLEEQNNRIVVSMPTSAGKTLTAELAILDSLTKKGNNTCIYITPSRALAVQIEDDLRKRLPKLGFKVSRLAGSYDCPEIEELKLENCRVLVTTPEKLNLLMKKDLPIFQSCNLFVFDEAQSLQGDNRGIHLELLMVRIRHLLPDRKFLLLSAVMNNPEEITNWIGENKGCLIDLEWHPTRTLQAIYSNGFVQYYEPLKSSKIKLPNSKATSIGGQVIDVAKSYRQIGSILIFCRSKRIAETTIQSLYNEGVYDSAESLNSLEELSRRIEFKFGSDFPLSKYIRKGLAYHHADLPAEIRSEIEKLVRAGDISIVASTTTLAEGINTPVSTVIVPYFNFQKYDPYGRKGFRGSRWTPLRKSLYRNIAGRAGRALKNTEGHVILIKPSNKEINYIKAYICSSKEQLEPIRSALYRLADIKRFDLEDKNVLSFQTEILALICDKVYLDDDPKKLLDFTFFGFTESRDSPVYETLVGHVTKQIDHLEQKGILTHNSPYAPTDFGSVCNVTGISPESCRLLMREIELLLQSNEKFFNIPVDEKKEFFRNRLLRILKLAFIPKEVRSSETFNPDIQNEKIALDWIFGNSQFDIAKYFKTDDIVQTMHKTFAYIHVQLMYYVPWVLWSVTKLLKFKNIKPSYGVRMLPAFAKYGTTDKVAVYCSALGVTSRKAAQQLATYFRENNVTTNFEAVMNWLYSLTNADLSKIIQQGHLLEYTYADILRGKDYMRLIK